MVFDPPRGVRSLGRSAVKRPEYFWAPTNTVIERSDIGVRPPVRVPSAMYACVASEVAGAIEALFMREAQNDVRPSVPFIYHIARFMQLQEGNDIGVSIYSALRGCFYYGYCSDDDWPLSPNSRYDDPVPAGVRDKALDFGVDEFKYIDKVGLQSNFRNACKLAISAGFPIIFSATVDDAFLDPQKTPEFDVPGNPGGLTHRHCFLAVAFDDAGFVVRDSISATRGPNGDGYLHMPYDYVEHPELARDFWTVMTVHRRIAADGLASPAWSEFAAKRAQHYEVANSFSQAMLVEYLKLKDDEQGEVNGIRRRPITPPFDTRGSASSV